MASATNGGSILDSFITKREESAAKINQTCQNMPSILESFGSPQKQRQMQHTGQVCTELSRLE